MDAVVKKEENMIEPKKEVEESVELKEPKVELIDEQDVKMEEIDEDEYQHMIPHEYRDVLEKPSDEQRVNSRKRRAVSYECRECGKAIIMRDIQNMKSHAAIHTNINRYFCPVEECDYKCYRPDNATSHMKHRHKMERPSMKDFVCKELSRKEEETLNKMTDECFPGMINFINKQKGSNTKHKFNCQLCDNVITELGWNGKVARRAHVHVHTDIMFYKCIKPDCGYKAKQCWSVRQHQRIEHGVITEVVFRLKDKLTVEQELEVERMVVRCFPELKDDSELRIKVIKEKEATRKKAVHFKNDN